MKITLQNQTADAKSFTEQASGELPLIMGGLSSIEISPKQFLAYERHIRGQLNSRHAHDKIRLVVSDDKIGIQEISPDQVLDGFRQGVFGDAVVALVTDSDERKAKHAAAMAEIEAERKMQRRETLARAGL